MLLSLLSLFYFVQDPIIPLKLLLSSLCSLHDRQANKSGDELLWQGIMTLIRKLADQEDGRLESAPAKSSLSPNSGSFIQRKGSGRGPLRCQPMADWDC